MKTQKTGKPILDALINASESFAEPCWCGNPDRNHAPEQPTHSVLQGKDLVKELIKRVQIQADKTEDEWENLEAERDQYKAHAERLAEALKDVVYKLERVNLQNITGELTFAGQQVVTSAKEALAQWEQQGHTWDQQGFCIYCHNVHQTDHNARSTCSDRFTCKGDSNETSLY